MYKTAVLAVALLGAGICYAGGSAFAQDEAALSAIKDAPHLATCRIERRDNNREVYLVFQLAAFDSYGKRYYRAHTNPPIQLIVAADGTVSKEANPCASDVTFLKR